MGDDLERPVRDTSLGSRMSALERDMYHLGSRIDEHLRASEKTHDRIAALAEGLDGRIDKIDRRLAYIAGAVGLAVFIGQVFAPVFRQLLGIPT